MSYTVTGESKSRLSELKKFAVSSDFFDRYFTSNDVNVDGVIVAGSDINLNPKVVNYRIGGIEYIDNIFDDGTTTTTFEFEGQGYDSPDFINRPIYKDPNKENIVQTPKVDSDVFIERQEVSAFEKNYNLEFVNSSVDLLTYAAGGYYKIINNT